MTRFTGRAALLLCAALAGSPAEGAPPAGEGGSARPRRAGPIAPEQFGRVFRRARTSIVQVRTSSAARAFDIGTFIGSEGELVFSAAKAPPPTVWVRADGRDHAAEVLGWSEASRLAVARARGADRAPIAPADPPDLALEEWVIAVRLDAAGRPEPFAGTVETTERPYAKDKRLGVVEIATPAQPGSPILSAQGGLVGFALDRGERRTRAVLLASLTPFLREQVLGR